MNQGAIILAYGGTGREIASILDGHYSITGFLDDVKTGPSILGPIAQWPNHIAENRLCSSLGSVRSMHRRRELLSAIPIEHFITYVDPSVKRYSGSQIGPGSFVCPFSVVSCDTSLGQHCFVYHQVVVSHDAAIGDFTIVSNHVCISGAVRIGRNCYIGAGAVIKEGVTVGDDSVIAANAAVINDVPPATIYIGPRKMKPNRFIPSIEQ